MTIDSMPRNSNSFRWGEIADDDDDDFDILLPPKQVIGPDQNGIKKVIEYKFNEEGKKVKITTTTRVQKKTLNKRAAERRSWAKFGDAALGDDGNSLTMRSTEEIHLERIRAPGSKAEEPKPSGDTQFGKAGAALMVCRLCHKKGDHWTARCPQKELLSMMGQTLGGETSSTEAGTESLSNKGGAYVHPGKRPNADGVVGSDMRRRNDENSVRVTNLSEDTREPDLMELFSPFGAVTRAYVAIDQRTGTSRGFGFVNFVSREDGQRAINKLNGYGYDNLILSVEWAAPRPPK